MDPAWPYRRHVPDPAQPDFRPRILRYGHHVSTHPTHDKLPIRMMHDRVLVRTDTSQGERRSSGGIVIPATAAVGRRLDWAEVVAVGQNVRTVEPGDRVLYDPEDRAEVEVRGVAYLLMRERDLHAVAAERLQGSEDSTGLYL
jgi:chaperonin GroES